MLRSTKELQGLTIHATDGDIGKVNDLYFDDDAWAVRYLVVDTGKWLSGRQVLVAPAVVQRHVGDWDRIEVSLSCEQVKNSPDFDTAEQGSRQKEQELSKYYHWPAYWGGGDSGTGAGIPGPLMGLAGMEPPPADLTPEEERLANPSVPIEEPASSKSHLQSAREVIGYRVQARDGDIGHIEDFLVDDQSWRINYLVIDTSNFWLGKKVILPPTWVRQVSWADRQAVVDLRRETIKKSPEFDSAEIKNQP